MRKGEGLKRAVQSRGKCLAKALEEQRTGAYEPAERWAWLAFRVCGRSSHLFKGLTSDNKVFKYFLESCRSHERILNKRSILELDFRGISKPC